MSKEKGKGKTAANKGKSPLCRMLDGKRVYPVLFDGRLTKQGRYMTGTIDDKMIIGKDGRPLQLEYIGRIE